MSITSNFEHTFLSTLSLRRATVVKMSIKFFNTDFYPRSPCGERPSHLLHYLRNLLISIHALLAESDSQSSAKSTPEEAFLSTLSLRRATKEAHTMKKAELFLSTLSLRRATGNKCCKGSNNGNFYPRSPCGERLEQLRQKDIQIAISIHALLAESDGSTELIFPGFGIFLSTLSLRRAT